MKMVILHTLVDEHTEVKLKLRPYILIPTYYLTQTSLDMKQYVWHVSVSRDDRKHW